MTVRFRTALVKTPLRLPPYGAGMGTTTADATGSESGPDTSTGSTAADLTKPGTEGAAGPGANATASAGAAGDGDAADGTGEAGVTDSAGRTGEADETAEAAGADEEVTSKGPSGVGQGAAAVVSVVLGLVSLTGSWLGTVASARETLIGQLRTSTSADVATQIKEIYGDAWQAGALWAGFFALVALIVGAVTLVRPAFGPPREPQVPWIKSVAWAGVSLGVIGLLLAVLKYTDVLLGLPSAT